MIQIDWQKFTEEAVFDYPNLAEWESTPNTKVISHYSLYGGIFEMMIVTDSSLARPGMVDIVTLIKMNKNDKLKILDRRPLSHEKMISLQNRFFSSARSISNGILDNLFESLDAMMPK